MQTPSDTRLYDVTVTVVERVSYTFRDIAATDPDAAQTAALEQRERDGWPDEGGIICEDIEQVELITDGGFTVINPMEWRYSVTLDAAAADGVHTSVLRWFGFGTFMEAISWAGRQLGEEPLDLLSSSAFTDEGAESLVDQSDLSPIVGTVFDGYVVQRYLPHRGREADPAWTLHGGIRAAQEV